LNRPWYQAAPAFRDRPAFWQIHDVIEGLALGDALSEPRGVFVRVAREAAALDSVPEKIAKRAAKLNDVRSESIQFYVTFIAKY
jgi:hypothetical protein